MWFWPAKTGGDWPLVRYLMMENQPLMDKPKEAYDIPSRDIDPLSYTQAIVGDYRQLGCKFSKFIYVHVIGCLALQS